MPARIEFGYVKVKPYFLLLVAIIGMRPARKMLVSLHIIRVIIIMMTLTHVPAIFSCSVLVMRSIGHFTRPGY